MQEQHVLFAQYLRQAYMVPGALGRWLGRSGLVTKHWRFNPSTQAAFQAQAVMGFYDTWVARSCSPPFCSHTVDYAFVFVLYMATAVLTMVSVSVAGTQMATCS